MSSYSQFGQDLEVLKFYDHKTAGYFLEIGASDGINLSNTYLLETQYDWTGICVEPLPSKFELLNKNRPKAICCSNAIYSESHQEVIFDIAQCDLLSGINSHISDRWKPTVDANKIQITVKTLTLNDLLEKYNAPLFIDYLSLDTEEGTEYEILKSVDLKKYKFGYIDVEHNFMEPTRSQIKKLLIENDYEFVRVNSCDDVYKYKFN
jgi:FkbM family methyltransferase